MHGVTAVVPVEGNVFDSKPAAAAHVLNAFGKASRLLPVMELGTLETLLVLSKRLEVGRCAEALVDHVLAHTPGVGSVNAVILECNDGRLNSGSSSVPASSAPVSVWSMRPLSARMRSRSGNGSMKQPMPLPRSSTHNLAS
jgi:L-aminopeptidase/D-esterase-like protein